MRELTAGAPPVAPPAAALQQTAPQQTAPSAAEPQLTASLHPAGETLALQVQPAGSRSGPRTRTTRAASSHVLRPGVCAEPGCTTPTRYVASRGEYQRKCRSCHSGRPDARPECATTGCTARCGPRSDGGGHHTHCLPCARAISEEEKKCPNHAHPDHPCHGWKPWDHDKGERRSHCSGWCARGLTREQAQAEEEEKKCPNHAHPDHPCGGWKPWDHAMGERRSHCGWCASVLSSGVGPVPPGGLQPGRRHSRR